MGLAAHGGRQWIGVPVPPDAGRRIRSEPGLLRIPFLNDAVVFVTFRGIVRPAARSYELDHSTPRKDSDLPIARPASNVLKTRWST
jgi:hypothetical protein